MSFTHLHTHSHYSLLQAVPKIDELIKRAKAYNMKALALTDNGNMYATIEFYKECKANDIKPIIGVDFYISPRKRTDKEGRLDSKNTRVVLLAKNYEGYKNLIKLVTESNLTGFYYKPRIDEELIKKYSDNLICIIPFEKSPISQSLDVNDFNEADIIFNKYFSHINKDDIYFEITKNDDSELNDIKIQKIIDFANKRNIELLATNNIYYLDPEDKKAQKTLMSVASNNIDRFDEDDGDYSFTSESRMIELFENDKYANALKNTDIIVEKCNIELNLGAWVFPKLIIENGKTADEVLKEVVYEGFEKRSIIKDEITLKRVEYELEVIKFKGYSPYFLIVADLLKFAKENQILSNIRGSVCGSMVTYLSGITHVNPIEFQIPFERFLNPERPSAPDIDMDYADDRRGEMVEYARRKYGAEKVAQIGTFGTMAARGSVKDVARALGFPYSLGDQISKLIPMGSQGFPMTIEKALEITDDLKSLYENNQDVKTIIDMAKKIEGSARHISVHAAGVVISPTELTDFTPLQMDTKGENKIITQYDMYSVEEAGLLKFDFLGLKNLKIIAECKKLIKLIYNIDIDIDNIPMDDKKTFEMLARGETTDLFQLNGDGMTKYLVDLKPTTIHDINAMVALYRPGPIQFIPLYIERKHNPSLITYMDDMLEDILNKTYGVLVYQDDLLMMAHKIAGYSWGEVDKFRKAVGKKIPEEMAKQKQKFIEGCVSHSSWSEKKATDVWKWIEPFAAYGFNKSHSVSYGRVAYITSYLKANFGSEYMASVLTAESGDTDAVAVSLAECERMSINILPPSINESFGNFTVIKADGILSQNDKIRFGLYSIKNFGEGIANSIISERKNGLYKSVEDIMERVLDKNLNKKSLESLIKAGALDEFGDRIDLLNNLESYLEYNKSQSKQDKSQISLFDTSENIVNNKTETIIKEQKKENLNLRLAFEKELLGFYLTGHPLDKYRSVLEKRDMNIAMINTNGILEKEYIIGGLITDIKEIPTKKDPLKKIMFFKIKDLTSEIECIVFPKEIDKARKVLLNDNCYVLKAKLSERDDKKNLIFTDAKLLG